jgi:predicted MPP superfamily phosphohydrolase
MTSLNDPPPASQPSGESTSFRVSCEARGPNLQFRSSRGFEWTRLDLAVAALPPALNGLRIVHLADLHCRPRWDAAYEDLIARLERHPPDMLLFGGDFVESKRDARPALPILRRLLPRLTSRLGTFAVLGNHDGDLVGPPLAGCGITFVDHRRLVMESGAAAIELIGLPGVDRLDLDLPWVNSLPQKDPAALRIVLCHYPDILPKVAQLQPDLYLAGHTHGGQVALPNRLPILRHDSLPRRLCSGSHRAFGTVLVANRGFGFSSPLPLRMFCPAEVVEIVLHKNASATI